MAGEETGPTDRPGPTCDPRAWVELHGDYLYRFALARVRRAEVAEDLVQEALLAAWAARASFDGRASERTWLTAILKRKAIDWLRKQVRERLRSNEEKPASGAAVPFTRRGVWKVAPAEWGRRDPATPLEQDEFWAALNGCMRKLPARLHDAFTLRYLDEAATDEVCKELGLTPTNLWVALHRARLRMWACLSQNWFGEEPAAGEKP